jgi:hypothetical protein
LDKGEKMSETVVYFLFILIAVGFLSFLVGECSNEIKENAKLEQVKNILSDSIKDSEKIIKKERMEKKDIIIFYKEKIKILNKEIAEIQKINKVIKNLKNKKEVRCHDNKKAIDIWNSYNESY